MFKFDFDIKEFEKSLSRLNQEVRENIAKSAAVAGAQVIRDEAKLRAPVYDPKTGERVNKKAKPGALRDAMYVAHSEKQSSSKQKAVTVSWNAKKAPHGHLVEFGHWLVINGKTIRRVPGVGFLGGAFEAASGRAIKAAQERIKQKLDALK